MKKTLTEIYGYLKISSTLSKGIFVVLLLQFKRNNILERLLFVEIWEIFNEHQSLRKGTFPGRVN